MTELYIHNGIVRVTSGSDLGSRHAEILEYLEMYKSGNATAINPLNHVDEYGDCLVSGDHDVYNRDENGQAISNKVV